MIDKATFSKLKLLDGSAEPGFASWAGRSGRIRVHRHKWKVLQPIEDPCRLFVKYTGLEYAFGNGWESDGPSIPNFVCALFGASREDFLRSGFLHDFCYRTGGAYVRVPGGEWEWKELDKETADALLWAGMLAEGAGRLFAGTAFLGVHSVLAGRNWEKYRDLASGIPSLGGGPR